MIEEFEEEKQSPEEDNESQLKKNTEVMAIETALGSMAWDSVDDEKLLWAILFRTEICILC